MEGLWTYASGDVLWPPSMGPYLLEIYLKHGPLFARCFKMVL